MVTGPVVQAGPQIAQKTTPLTEILVLVNPSQSLAPVILFLRPTGRKIGLSVVRLLGIK